MEIWFYKGGTGRFSKLIKWFTGGPYSHVEIKPLGRPCISSSEKDGGVRWAPWIVFSVEKWDRYEVVGFTPEDEERIIRWAEGKVGAKYDWRGILQYLAFYRRNKDGDRLKWYCSEFCQFAIALAHVELFDHTVRSPNGLYALLKELDLIRPLL